MIIERSMHPGWLSNSYLVGDATGGTGVLIDSGGPHRAADRCGRAHDLTMTHLLITHADADHIAGNDVYVKRFGIPVAAHQIEADRMGGADILLADGDHVRTGDLDIVALFTPGHSPGSPLVSGQLQRLLHRRRAVQGHGRRHPARLVPKAPLVGDGRAAGAPRRYRRSPGPHGSRPRSAPSGSRTRSSASGGESMLRARVTAPLSTARPHWCCSDPTTTADIRHGFAGTIPGRTTSSPEAAL